MKENIELLEKELNSLGENWNLFGKVDRMKFLLKEIKNESNSKFEEDEFCECDSENRNLDESAYLVCRNCDKKL